MKKSPFYFIVYFAVCFVGLAALFLFAEAMKDGPLSDAVKYGRACGLRDIGTQVVPFAEAGLSEAAKRSVVNSFPLCARALLIAK